MKSRSIKWHLIISAVITLAGSVHAAIQWDNGGSDNDWYTAENWDSNTAPVAGDHIYINQYAGSPAVYSAGTSPNYADIRVGSNVSGITGPYTGVLNITGGTLSATSGTGDSRVGQGQTGSPNGTVNQTGGEAAFNSLRIGLGANASGAYNLSEGTLNINKAYSGVSLSLGFGSGNNTGLFEISGGGFSTRAAITIGDALGSTGTFSVVGANASEINIGSVGTFSGSWKQAGGSSLKIGIDNTATGATPIFIDYVDDDGLEGSDITFEAGALLDVYFTGAFTNAGTFTVMTWEEGASVIDNGLQFASSVDTNVWSFNIDETNRKLTVTAEGLSLPDDLGPLSYEVSANGLILSWIAENQFNYALEVNSNLTSGTWIPVQTNIAGIDGELSVTGGLDAAVGFYRITLE